MNIGNDLPGFKMTARRMKNFELMIHHIMHSCAEVGERNIIETGCAWDKGNWDGHGQSTLIWDWVAENNKSIHVTSIDITPSSVAAAKAQTKNVEYIERNSVPALNEMAPWFLEKTFLLYLDSFDWIPEANIDSAFHHLAELTACWRHLPIGCMIVVDDRHGDLKGKHFMVEAFMTHIGVKPLFKNHQIGWIKP